MANISNLPYVETRDKLEVKNPDALTIFHANSGLLHAPFKVPKVEKIETSLWKTLFDL